MLQFNTSQLKALPLTPNKHHHDYHQLVLGVEGHALFDVRGGGENQIALGKGCLLPANYEHRYQSPDTNQVLVINFELGGTGISGQEIAMLQRLFSGPMYFSVDQPFCTLLNALVYELQLSNASVQTQHHVRALMLYSLYERIVGRACNSEVGQSRINIDNVDEYIQRHIHEKISVAQLADFCHISVSRFHVHFRKMMNQSPYQYIMRRRVERAAWLLKTSRQTIGDIARKTGFPNQSSLNVAVKREYGTSPTALRNNS